MQQISGRVLVKETNAGIPDLVVAVYDIDPIPAAPTPPPPAPAPVIQNATRTRTKTVTAEALSVSAPALPGFGQLRNRLGSVLTDRLGNFSLPISAETARHYGRDGVPDLVIAVFAPEDVLNAASPLPATEEQRLLYLSRTARDNAGPVEAYVIRLLRERLEAFGIPTSATPEPVTIDDEASRFVSDIERGWNIQEAIGKRLGQSAQTRVDAAQARRQAGDKLAKGLSRLPAARQKTASYWAAPGADVGALHAQAMADGLAQVSQYAPRPAFNLTTGQAKTLGLTIKSDGSATGKVDPVLFTQTIADKTGPDLVRVRSLIDSCCPPAQVVAKTLANPNATTSGTTTPAPPASAGPVTRTSANDTILDRIVGQIDDLASGATPPSKRPTLDDIIADVEAFTPTGGPSDATAFHDFKVLQVAFRDVWIEAFDQSMRDQVSQLYQEATRLYDAAGLTVPNFDDLQDADDLNALVKEITTTLGWAAPPPVVGTGAPTGTVRGTHPATGWSPVSAAVPTDVQNAFPKLISIYPGLSLAQQMAIQQQAANWKAATSAEEKAQAVTVATIIASEPGGSGGRLAELVEGLGAMLSRPYAFDVFAPGTYNFGIMVTYRQKWSPLGYQTGDLVSTIPLAPGETRKYTTKHAVKTSRKRDEAEKSSSSRSTQESDIARAEAEIMKKAVTTTNFNMSAHASFSIGVASLGASTAFSLNQEQQSAGSKKDFHEATLKAAEEYRLERSTQIETNVSDEYETTTSGEISNPNSELTVTYLFYELQRRYRIEEQLHAAQPVIMVALDMPAPHEITEAWLVANQWIIARVLLDRSLEPALDYLSTGRAGDEVSIVVLKASWEAQAALVSKLEAQVTEQQTMRDSLRESLVTSAFQQAIESQYETPMVLKVLSMNLAPDPAGQDVEHLKAEAKAAKTRLGYVEDALSDAQKKLTDASAAFTQATKDYAAAMQNQYSRQVAIDQLLVHIKLNALYYMQAVWDSMVPDQRFFQLYDLDVTWPAPATGCRIEPHTLPPPALGIDVGNLHVSFRDRLSIADTARVPVGLQLSCGPTVANVATRKLVDIADLDNPLGYKGNYIIFPLKMSNYLTDFMLQEYVDDYFGVSDPDEAGNYSIDDLGKYVACVLANPDVSKADKDAVEKFYIDRLTDDRPSSDEIIVPTGQLFIEALPGSHTLLEDFKIRHRYFDELKVAAEVRHAELENLRLAARLVEGQSDTSLLADPEIDRQIIVEGASSVSVNTGV